MNGVIIVDKPSGWTSHDVVARMRRILQQRSIGHLGTLDPLATGVLPLVTGSLTRLAQFYISSEKTYEGIIRFGFATNTYDADGEPLDAHVGRAAPDGPTANRTLHLADIQSLAAQFLGHIEQTPPPFSAKKINGVPAYKFARKQKVVILKAVQVEIKEFEITQVDGDNAQFRARVSSGTYMRSIAHEMGQLLGCGAHLASLRRTSVAEFNIFQSHTIEEIESAMKNYVRGAAANSAGRATTNPARGEMNEYAAGEMTNSARQGKDSDQENACHSEPVRRTGEEPAFASAAHVWGGRPRPPLATPIQDLTALFLHPRQLLPHLPSVTADEPTSARIRSGRPVNLPDVSRSPQIKVFASQSDLLAIATRIAGTLFHPKIVFPQD
jgi:tRNA pseudouridine55 synthase